MLQIYTVRRIVRPGLPLTFQHWGVNWNIHLQNILQQLRWFPAVFFIFEQTSKPQFMKRNFIYTIAFAAAIAFTSCAGDSGKGTDGADSTKTDNSASADAPAASKGKYAIKSGIITYDTEAMGMKMPTTLYFDDYGNKECQEVKMEMEMMGTKVTTHNMTITMDGYVYTLDLTNKTGTKMKAIGTASSMTGVDFSNLSEQYLQSMKMSKEGSESICGKTCDVFKMDNEKMSMKGTFAIYNSIPMRTNMEAMGMPVTMLATKFEENVSIPTDKFTIPTDFKITEM